MYWRAASLVTTRPKPLAGPGLGSSIHAEQRRAAGAAQPTQKLRRAVVVRALLTLKAMPDDVQVAVTSPTARPTTPDVLHVLPALAATMEPDAGPW